MSQSLLVIMDKSSRKAVIVISIFLLLVGRVGIFAPILTPRGWSSKSFKNSLLNKFVGIHQTLFPNSILSKYQSIFIGVPISLMESGELET